MTSWANERINVRWSSGVSRIGGCRRCISIAALGLLLAAIAGPACADVSFTGDVTLNPPFVEIGNQGVGSLVIDGGSTLFSNNVEIGQEGIGFAEVIGPGSFWDINSATIGMNGFGQLDIRDRGLVDVQGQLRLGWFQEGEGRVSVQGLGTVLQVSSLAFGAEGAGKVTILDEAIVDVEEFQSEIGPRGIVELQQGLFRTFDLQNAGIIKGSGKIHIKQGGLENFGRIEAYVGDLLTIEQDQGSDEIENLGMITVDGGEIDIPSYVINGNFAPGSAAEITVRDGTIRFGPAEGPIFDLDNRGVLAATGGLSDLYGRVRNEENGDIAVTNDSVLIFHDDVEANGGTITVFPGSTAIFLEDLTMNEPSVLLAQLAGTEENGFGTAEVVGDAMLSGSLNVALSAGFSPELGDSFPLLTAAGGIDGIFELGDAPQLPDGLQWNLDIGENQVLLSVVPEALTGDYNGDGKVSAADFTVWRDSLGAADLLNRDPHNGGPVDEDDFNSWMANFGKTLEDIGTGFASGSAAVPEPGTLVMLLITVVGFASTRPNRRRGYPRR